MSQPFILGQKVTITDAGYVYAFCDPAAEKFGLKNYIPGQGLSVKDGATGVIAGEATYFPEGDVTLAAITLDEGYDVLIDTVAIGTQA